MRLVRLRWGARGSLRRRLAVVTATMLVLLLAGTAIMVGVVNETRIATDRRTALGRAQLHVLQLEMAVIDEETALRGFLLSGDEAFLAPLERTQGTWPGLYRTVLRDARLASDTGRARAVTQEIADLHRRWLDEVARPEIELGRDDLDAARASEASGRGRALVDGMRQRLDDLAVETGSRRDAALARERRLRTAMLLAGLGLGGSLAVVLLLIVVTARREVLRPLRRLGAAARAVANGQRQRAVAVDGPTEVRAVAADVEAMRGELIHHIAQQERLVEGLRQQGPAVVTLRSMLTHPISDQLPGVTIAGRCLAGEGLLTGDWYDVLALPDGRVALTLGDVAGHGTAPAITALAVKHALAGALAAGQAPDVALVSATTVFAMTPAPGVEVPLLASAFVLVVDPRRSRLAYVNAGHPAGLLWPPSGAGPLALEPTGPVLCQLTANVHHEVVERAFPSGSVLVLYTDGVVEARPPHSQDQYGEERLVARLRGLVRDDGRSEQEPAGGRADQPVGAEPDERLLTAVFTDVLDHAGEIRDDATLLITRR